MLFNPRAEVFPRADEFSQTAMKIFALLISILLIFAPAETAAAFSDSSSFSSSCAPTETGTPVCAFWTRADAVFTGKALKVEAAPKNEGFPEGARKVRFQIQQNFKGADNPTFTVVSTADCGFQIKSGQTWIVYARNDLVLKSFSAFRAVRIEPQTTGDEAAVLKNIADGKSETAVTGQFILPPNAVYRAAPVEIAVEGGGKLFTAKSDANGAFHVAVPDGNYRVELKFPYRAAFKWDENLLGTSLSEGVPTLFGYDVRLNDGDCHFGFFEVSEAKN